MGHRVEQERAYENLGDACDNLGNFELAIEYYMQYLSIARDVGDKAHEARACRKLGDAFESLSNFKEAIEYHNKHLSIAKASGDQAEEGVAYSNLGNAYESLGDFKKALEYHNLDLNIARELGDTLGEGQAYSNLGRAYSGLGDFKTAMECHERHLRISEVKGDRAGEGAAYCNLGIVYQRLGDFKQAVKYHTLDLSISKELGDRAGEGSSYGNLGNTYHSIGDFKQAIEYHKNHLSIAKEVGDLAGQGAAYCNLGRAYRWVGDLNQAVMYFERDLRIAQELGNRAGEGTSYSNLGNAYFDSGDFENSMAHHQMDLSIAQEVGDNAAEGRAYGKIGRVCYALSNFEKAIEYQQKFLRIAKELGDKVGEGKAYADLGKIFYGLGDLIKAKEYYRENIRITKEVGDRAGEGGACYLLGRVLESTGSLDEAVGYFRSSLEIYNNLKVLLQSEDSWKINFRKFYYDAYTALWRTLLKLQKTNEALLVAEQGRAEALVDLMKSRYGTEVPTSDPNEYKEMTSDMLTDIPTQTVFVAFEGNTINLWVLCKMKEIHFRQKEIDWDTSQRLLENAERVIFSLNEHSSLQLLYDIVIGPIADLLQGDEVIIVPDGVLNMAPYSAFIDHDSKYLSEYTRVRVIPSLTSLQLINRCPEGHHLKSGVLLVGDPYTEEVITKAGCEVFKSLPYAREEVEMIGKLLKTTPLIGKNATKSEVLKQIGSVSLVHIAAHGLMETGEIILAPNPSRRSKIPNQEDFLLAMSDVQAVRLQARLVVLSCSNSGRGSITAEGVVGIARSFLGAGARSILVAFWEIDNEATMEFMRSFYQQLVDGKSTSVALHLAMKSLRDSEEFADVRYWAPFVLIGDDVRIEFGEEEEEEEEKEAAADRGAGADADADVDPSPQPETEADGAIEAEGKVDGDASTENTVS